MRRMKLRVVTPEAWGGDTIVVEMSAQQNVGVDELLDQLLAVAEVEELTAIQAFDLLRLSSQRLNR